MPSRIAVAMAVVLAAGCGDAHPPVQGGGAIINPGGGGGDTVLPDTGSSVDTAPPEIVDGYAAGPYGKSPGTTFPALTFDGYTDGSTTWSKLDMRSYFDPDGSKGERAVVVIVAAQWCPVCQQEARWMPPEYLKTWKSRGARFLTVLIEDADHHPSVKLVADQWRDTFSIPYAIGIDPDYRVLPTDVGAIKLPYTFVIDPRTMKIEQVYSAAIAPPTIPALDTVLARNGG